MKKKRTFQERTQTEKGKGFVVSVLIGSVVFFLCGTGLLAAFCIPALLMEDPMRSAPFFSAAAVLISAFAGGRVSARTYGKKGLVCGASCGMLVIMLTMLANVSLRLTIHPLLFGICAPLTVLISCIAGASVGQRKRKKGSGHKIRF